MNKPNIIFYFSDQQRFDTICEDVTPNLLEMADEGLMCENMFTCQPVCGPARACLQSGEYASKNGCYINGISLDKEKATLAKTLNDNGYETAYVGKWHLASDDKNPTKNYRTKAIPNELRGGYKDYWIASDCLEFTSNGYGGYLFDANNNKVEFNGIRSDAINNYALDFINQEHSKPFFLFVSQLDPHHQNSTDMYECVKGEGEKFKKHQMPGDLKALKGNSDTRYYDYLACCERLDYNVGLLIKDLKEKKIWDNTILIYTSDHGCHFKTRNKEYKRSCHDASTHIPLIIAGGALNNYLDKDVKVYEGLTSLIDVPPTILSLAGCEVPKNYDGQNMFDMFNGKSNRDCVYIQISESQLGRAIRTKDYTYSVKTRFGFGMSKACGRLYVEDCLYDNNKDPDQLENLIRDPNYVEIKEELRQMLLDEMRNNGESHSIIKKKGKII